MENLVILLFIFVANIVSILLIYHSFDKRIEKTKKLLYTMISMGVVYIVVLIIYFFSSIGIDKEIAKSSKQMITFTFVPVNSIIIIPFLIRSFNKRKDNEISGEQLNKRAIAAILVVGEFFYFRNIEKEIGKIIEQQQENMNNTTSNVTEENTISNTTTDNTLLNMTVDNTVLNEVID